MHTAGSSVMTMQEQLRALIERNHTKLLEQLATVTRLLAARDRADTFPPSPIIEAQGLTHQMKGAAGSIGFGKMGSAAAALDKSLRMLGAQGRAIPADQLEPSLALLAALQRVARESTPNQSTLYDADLSRLAR